jgi:Holliday junction resolvase RusA-like endonuclease
MEETGWRPFTGPVQLRVTFYMHRGKTVKREMPSVPPDLDKLVRGVGDALTYGEAWGDDSQVVSMVVEKVYADDRAPGAEIEIHSVTV